MENQDTTEFNAFLQRSTAICEKVDGKNVYNSGHNLLQYKDQIMQHFGELAQLYKTQWFMCGLSQIDFNPTLNELRVCIDVDYYDGYTFENYVAFTNLFANAKLVNLNYRKEWDNLSFNFVAINKPEIVEILEITNDMVATVKKSLERKYNHANHSKTLKFILESLTDVNTWLKNTTK